MCIGKSLDTHLVLELGKLEAKFEKTEPEVKSKSVAARSKAPEPIKPLKSGNSGVDVKVDSDGAFHGTYQQWKAARLAGKIR